MASSRFAPGLVAPAERGPARWFAFRRGDLLVAEAAGGVRIPVAARLEDAGVTPIRAQYLGTLDGEPCFSAELAPDAEAPSGHRLVGLRALHAALDGAELAVAGFAAQIKEWDRTHQHCGACGRPTAPKSTERARRCEACALDFFPRVTPATIVLVSDGTRILMTRQARFPAGMYGLVAGFVEPGETLEECVAREVREETGLEVDDLRYFGSQPWPYPHQLMVGYFARLAGGELTVDHGELEDARWFDRDALPPLPPRISIARALVEAWLSGGAPR